MRTSRRAFTLVELLVVITIIAMLAGLLLPAIQNARRTARQTQCANNMRNVALAIVSYESSKQKMPPSYSYPPNSPVPPTHFYGWVPKLLSNLGRNDLYELYSAGTLATLAAAPRVDLLICPGAPPSSAAAPINFVVNCGRADLSVTGNLPDHRENGVFFSELILPAPPTGVPAAQPLSMSYIARNDGTANTLMVSENLNAKPSTNWSIPDNIDNCWITNTFGEALTGIVWFPFPSTTPPGTPTVPLNKLADSYPSPGDINWGRPSSTHVGGFNAAFCDGSLRFLSEEIEYRVYCLIMTPLGNKSKDPGATSATNYPAAWVTAPSNLIPLKDSDLTK